MPLTEYHKQRNEQRLRENMNQPHVSREEMVEQTLRVIRRSEDQLYQDVLKDGPFPGMTIVQSMIERKRRVHREWFRPDFSFRYYSEDEQGNVLIGGGESRASETHHHPHTFTWIMPERSGQQAGTATGTGTTAPGTSGIDPDGNGD